MRRMTRLAPLALLGGLLGCAEQRLAQERLNFRTQSMGFIADGVVEREKRAGANLAGAAAYIDQLLRHDAQTTGEDLIEVDRYIHKDVERFIDRLPAYRQEVERQLGGKPQDIERNAILIFE